MSSAILECEPVAVAMLTGRMGSLSVESRGATWRGELLASGRMGAVTRNGEPNQAVPEWFQRRLARATAMLQAQYPAAKIPA